MNIDLGTPLVTHTFIDYPDPEADALIVCFIGCPHNCEGCHNYYLQGKEPLPLAVAEGQAEVTGYKIAFHSFEEAEAAISLECRRHNTSKLVLQGGEPLFAGNNLEFTKYICSIPKYEVCIYTGYSAEYAKATGATGFSYIKCGCFEQASSRVSQKTDDEFTLASPNQEFYNSNFEQISTAGVLNFHKQPK